MPDLSEFTFSPIADTDREPVIDLFNYYTGHSFAAYPEQKVPYGFFTLFPEACHTYPSVAAKSQDGILAGFGLLRAHNPMPAFRHAAEITCFIRPDLTGKGLGSEMPARLEKKGKDQGITTILASISSQNEGSIRFHAGHGFTECGRFKKVGRKKGIIFDTVWMQKFI
jgi:phosphinothricin acetyltransferase